MKDNDQSNNSNYERDLWELEKRQRFFRRIQEVLQIYAVLGFLIGFFAFAYFFFRQLKIELSQEDEMILLVAMTGFSISIMSVLLLFLRRQGLRREMVREAYANSASKFLVLWAKFEAEGQIRLEATGQKFNSMSVREIISRLVAEKVLTPSDAATLEEVLRFRNAMVHGGTQTSPDSLRRMTTAIGDIVDKLEP